MNHVPTPKRTDMKLFVCADKMADEAWKLLEDSGVQWESARPSKLTEFALHEQIRKFDPDAILVRQGKISGELMAVLPRLKAVAKHGVGLNNIDVGEATKRRIPVFFTANANFQSVAEMTLGLVLSILRRIPQAHQRTRSGKWETGLLGEELYGKSVGLIGFGCIGKRFWEITSVFHLQGFIYDPYVNLNSLPKNLIQLTDLDELLRRSDIISLHCPLTESTRHLIDESCFRAMRKTAVLINTARGEIVDETSLVRALESGEIAGAALDTFETEPPPANHPLFQMDQVIVTNHLGGSSRQSMIRMGVRALEILLDELEGKEPDITNLANPEVLLPKPI